MTCLGIEITDREQQYGWESNTPTIHRTNPLIDYSIRAYKIADKMLDEGGHSWDEIDYWVEIAKYLNHAAHNGEDCNCFLPEQSCKLCRIVAEVINCEE